MMASVFIFLSFLVPRRNLPPWPLWVAVIHSEPRGTVQDQ